MPQGRRDVGRFFPDIFEWTEGLPGLMPWGGPMDRRTIRVEEFTEKGRYVLRAELPGLDPEKNVNVQVAEGVLTIQAERQEEEHEGGRSEFRYGSFVRRVPLPPGADESNVEATYDAGILTVSVPIDSSEPKKRDVPIRTGA